MEFELALYFCRYGAKIRRPEWEDNVYIYFDKKYMVNPDNTVFEPSKFDRAAVTWTIKKN